MLREPQEAAQLGAKAKVHRLVCTVSQKRTRSERQALHARGGCIAVFGRVKKVAGVSGGRGRDVGEYS